LGPAISTNAIVPPASIADMDAFAVSGSVGEVGAKVEMIHEAGQKWEMTTSQDGEFSFSPYIDVPTSGGAALPQIAQNLVHKFRLEATDALGNKSVTGELTWIVNVDVAVEEFTFGTGPKYTSVRPTFSGTVDAGSTVSLLYSGQTLEAVAGPDKAWSLAIPEDLVALDEGQELSLRFTATDPAGNQRIVDHIAKVWTQAPVFGSTSAVTTGSRNYSFTGEVTPAAGQQFGGVVSVELIVEDSNGTVLSNAGSISHSGVTLSGMLSLPEANGDYVMKWKATNNYGTSTTVSTVVSLDTVSPSVIITAEPQLDKTGRIKVGGAWSDLGSDEVPAITVEIESVVYRAGTVEKHTGGGDNSGVWECVLQTDSGASGTIENGATAISFVDKTYAITVTVTDGAGNEGITAGSMVVDSTAPTLSLGSTPQLQNHATEYEVHISLWEPALKSLTLGVSTGVVDLLNPSAHPGLSLSAGVQTNSDFAQEIVVKPNIVLSDQQYQVTVSATDIYDRTTTRTTLIDIDTQAPQVTVAAVNVTTSDGIVNFSGTVQSSSDSVEVSYPQGDPAVLTAFSAVGVGDDNGVGTWSLQGTNVSYGTSSLYVRATDPAGNLSTTLHSFVHTAAAPLAAKGEFVPITNSYMYVHLSFDTGVTHVWGVVSEFDNIEYIEASIHGEYHKLEGTALTDALLPIPGGFAGSLYGIYAGSTTHRSIQLSTGPYSNSYVSGTRHLWVSTSPVNIISVTVKWKDHAAGLDGAPNWIVHQTYQDSGSSGI